MASLQSKMQDGKNVIALTTTGKIVLVLLVAVLVTTTWMALDCRKSASMMETALEKILDSFKIEWAQRQTIELKLNDVNQRLLLLEERLRRLEVKTAPENQPSTSK